jgi:hypothetical protein
MSASLMPLVCVTPVLGFLAGSTPGSGSIFRGRTYEQGTHRNPLVLCCFVLSLEPHTASTLLRRICSNRQAAMTQRESTVAFNTARCALFRDIVLSFHQPTFRRTSSGSKGSKGARGSEVLLLPLNRLNLTVI